MARYKALPSPKKKKGAEKGRPRPSSAGTSRVKVVLQDFRDDLASMSNQSSWLTKPSSSLPRNSSNDRLLIQPRESRDAPVDHGRVVYFVFFMQGMGMLFPWNVYITANAYFALRLKDTEFKSNFENLFSLTYTVFNFIFLWLAVRYGKSRYFNMVTAVALPMGLQTIVLLSSTFLVLSSDINPYTLFAITIISVAVSGACTALLQGGIFALAGRFPPVYTSAVMTGQGAAGLAVSLSSIATTLGEPCTSKLSIDDVRWSAFAYFMIASVVVVSSFIAFMSMSRITFAQHYAFGWGIEESFGNGQEETYPTLYEEGSPASERSSGNWSTDSVTRRHRSILESPVYTQEKMTPRTSPTASPMQSSGNVSPSTALNGDAISVEEEVMSSCELVGHIRKHAFSVAMVFAVTLCIFPAITSDVRSMVNVDPADPCPQEGRFYGDLWVPFSFLMFNVGDTTGRFLAVFKFIPASKIYLLSIFRIIFIPLFIMCNVVPSTFSPPVLAHDFWPIILMLLLALSNGYAASQEMMNGPMKVEAELQSRAGTMMVFFLQLGLILGSLMSFIARGIICSCNPFVSNS